jgi:hypothetical protein
MITLTDIAYALLVLTVIAGVFLCEAEEDSALDTTDFPDWLK